MDSQNNSSSKNNSTPSSQNDSKNNEENVKDFQDIPPDKIKELESASLSTLILSISSSAVIHMGIEPNFKDKKDLVIAKFNIDMLEILKEKTEQHRTEEETKLLDRCLQDLRMHFIRLK